MNYNEYTYEIIVYNNIASVLRVEDKLSIPMDINNCDFIHYLRSIGEYPLKKEV